MEEERLESRERENREKKIALNLNGIKKTMEKKQRRKSN